jgi:hypothetical protein
MSLKMAALAGFLKKGAKNYFQDQMAGKRCGQTYDFVLRDAGNVVEGLVASPRDIVEKKVSLTIKNYNNAVSTDALEGVTDISWQDEIAETYAKKLIQKVEADAVEDSITKATTCFVGEGFAPMANAGAYLQSITNEDIYGFIDPQAQATLAANGQQFVPTGSPSDLYSRGRLGTFQNVEYTAERFIKPLTISQDTVNALSAAKGASLNAAGDELTISGVATAANVVLKKGTPISFDSVFACDTVGDATNVPYSFIAGADVALSSTAVAVPVTPVVTADIGARSIVGEFAAKAVKIPASGSYYRGIVRADGAFCNSEVPSLEFKLSDKTAAGDTDGVKVFVNSFTDGISAINTTRFDHPCMIGVVEPRAESIIMWKK